MRITEETAALSHARRLQVGCVIVKDGRTLSFGYNGTPSGWDNCCEDTFTNSCNDIPTVMTKTKPEVLHAESNMLMKLCQSSESSKGATVFITHSPCIECAKLLFQSGVSSVVYKQAYRSSDGIDFLIKCGVEVIQYT